LMNEVSLPVPFKCMSAAFRAIRIVLTAPAQSQIVEASAKTPLLVMSLRFDTPIVQEILQSGDLPENVAPISPASL
jgi:hypothetical protein